MRINNSSSTEAYLKYPKLKCRYIIYHIFYPASTPLTTTFCLIPSGADIIHQLIWKHFITFDRFNYHHICLNIDEAFTKITVPGPELLPQGHEGGHLRPSEQKGASSVTAAHQFIYLQHQDSIKTSVLRFSTSIPPSDWPVTAACGLSLCILPWPTGI